MKHSWVMVVLAAALAAACHKDEQVGETQTTSASTTWGEALSGRDRALLEAAARSGMLEIQLGTEAAARGKSDDVKALGASMVDDHSKANAELVAIARKKHVVLPTTLDVEQEKTYRELTDLEGKKFDAAYAKDMVADREQAVLDLEKANPDDADLKAWIERTLPRVKDHLARAKAIDDKLAKGPRPKTMGP